MMPHFAAASAISASGFSPAPKLANQQRFLEGLARGAVTQGLRLHSKR